MRVEHGFMEFHPSSLSETIHVRIEKDMIRPRTASKEKYVGTAITRMRYRGPIESYKINRTKSEVYKALFILQKKFDLDRERLILYIIEALTGNSAPIKVKQNSDIIFNKTESVQLELINHIITDVIDGGK